MRNALSTDTTNGDLEVELLQVRIFGEFRGISQLWDWEATTANQLKIYIKCTLQNCVLPCINSPKITSLGAIIVHAMSRAFTLALARLSCILL